MPAGRRGSESVSQRRAEIIRSSALKLRRLAVGALGVAKKGVSGWTWLVRRQSVQRPQRCSGSPRPRVAEAAVMAVVMARTGGPTRASEADRWIWGAAPTTSGSARQSWSHCQPTCGGTNDVSGGTWTQTEHQLAACTASTILRPRRHPRAVAPLVASARRPAWARPRVPLARRGE